MGWYMVLGGVCTLYGPDREVCVIVCGLDMWIYGAIYGPSREILTSYCTVLDFIHECLFCFYGHSS